MAFQVADVATYYAEQDPGFKEWIEEHKKDWEKIKEGVKVLMQGELKGPLEVMQKAITDQVLGSPEFKDFVSKQISDIIDSVWGVFCPASDEEVAAASAKTAFLAGKI